MGNKREGEARARAEVEARARAEAEAKALAAERGALLEHCQPRLDVWQPIERDARHAVRAYPGKGGNVGNGECVSAQERPVAFATETLLHDFEQASRFGSVTFNRGRDPFRHETLECDALAQHGG